MSGSLHTRLPRTLGTVSGPKQHFRAHAAGGICLDVPVYASEPGQFTVIRNGHFTINVNGTGDSDLFITVNDQGALNIRLDLVVPLYAWGLDDNGDLVPTGLAPLVDGQAWQYDDNGDLVPTGGIITFDPYWEYDGNGDLTPK